MQGDKIGFHQVFNLIKSMMTQDAYGGTELSPRERILSNLSTVDLGEHIKRVRSSSLNSEVHAPYRTLTVRVHG